jgi:hypothetical protein
MRTRWSSVGVWESGREIRSVPVLKRKMREGIGKSVDALRRYLERAGLRMLRGDLSVVRMLSVKN